MALWVLIAWLGAQPGGNSQVGNATIFGTAGDKWAGGPAACATKLPGGKRRHMPISWHRKNGTKGIAHRFLPCGTRVVVKSLRTGKKVKAVVIDRGPFGACTYPGWSPKEKRCPPGYWVVKKKRKHPGTWRGVADLLPATAEAIGHGGGLERVEIRWPRKAYENAL